MIRRSTYSIFKSIILFIKINKEIESCPNKYKKNIDMYKEIMNLFKFVNSKIALIYSKLGNFEESINYDEKVFLI